VSRKKSAAEHALNGTASRYEGVNESHVAGKIPKPPKFLSEDERKKFKAVAKSLAQRRAITEGDMDLIATFCTIESRWQRAIVKVAEEGEVCSYERLDSSGEIHFVEKPNLHLKIAQDSEKQKVAILVRLGLTPDSRERVRPTSAVKPRRAPESENSLENLAMTCERLRAEFAAEQQTEKERAGQQPVEQKTDEQQAAELEAAMGAI
jgi:P27 family predicted phage terminase small subunit